MKEENYRCALDCYTKAIDLDLRNAVYYCNRYALIPARLQPQFAGLRLKHED